MEDRQVCVSSRHGLLVPGSQPIEPKWRTLSAPLHPRHVGKDGLLGLRQQRLRGPVLLVCCWRQHRFRSNPAHLLYGYGTILTAAVQGSVPRNLSAVLLHQCPAIGKWPLAVAISNIVLEVARERGLITASTRFITLSPSSTHYQWEALPSSRAGDELVCASPTSLHVRTQYGKWLPCRRPPVLAAWQAHLRSWLAVLGLPADPSPTRAVVWRRDSHSNNAKRRIVNLAEVTALFEPAAHVVSASEELSAVEQVRLFRSFALLVSTHGSHLVGLVFSPPHVVVVELQSEPSDMMLPNNAPCFVARYVLSTGHATARPLRCNSTQFSCRMRHKEADLQISTDRLRADLGASCWWTPNQRCVVKHATSVGSASLPPAIRNGSSGG